MARPYARGDAVAIRVGLTGRTAGFPHARPALAPDAGTRVRRRDCDRMPTNVLIAGGGPAALEAALALHRLAGDRVSTTLLAPEADLTYRPLSVLAPFAAGGATTYPLEQHGRRRRLHPRSRPAGERRRSAAHAVTTIARRAAGLRRAADRLRRASRRAVPGGDGVHRVADRPGAPARHRPGRRGAATCIGSRSSSRPGNTWPLPLYELALMLAERAYEMGATSSCTS